MQQVRTKPRSPKITHTVDHFIMEEEKPARAHFMALGSGGPLRGPGGGLTLRPAWGEEGAAVATGPAGGR